MEQYVALDVSLKDISICIIDSKGEVVLEGKTAAEPATLVELIRSKAPHVKRVGLETGATSPWLFHALAAAGLPVVCMDARHAHAALSMRPTKSDRSDARGLADMLRMGWYREVHAKSVTSHEHPTILGARHQLVTMRSELDAQIRGILKTFGLILGTGNKDTLIQRAEKLAAGHPVLSGLVAKLAKVRRHVTSQINAIDRDIRHLVHTEPTLKRLISVPGVGPITALAFLSAVDDPSRFKHARDVGPYLGLTPTRYQSGETDRQGRISKCGDTFTPHLPLRGGPRAADQGSAVLAIESLGHALSEADRRQEGAHRGRSQDCRHPALYLDRRYRVLVDAREGSLTRDPPH